MTAAEVLAGEARWAVECARAGTFLASLPAGSVDLIVTDPPYHRVKALAWDREHATAGGFLDWLGGIAAEWARVLKPNGSLYCFASPQMAARVECKIAEHLRPMNQIVWSKATKDEAGMHRKQHKEGLRTYFPNTERIVFAEHYGADAMARGEADYHAKCDELRGFVFEPLRAYVDGERERAGLSRAQVDAALGNCMSGHYFSRVQWALPTRENYEALRAAFVAAGAAEPLRREYEDLRREYEDLRRPFAVSADVPYTDVWDYPTVQVAPGKHPCEKPEAMALDIVRASSRHDAVVLDCFAGSGVFAAAAVALERRALACDMDPRWAAQTAERCATVVPLVAAPANGSPAPRLTAQTTIFDLLGAP